MLQLTTAYWSLPLPLRDLNQRPRESSLLFSPCNDVQSWSPVVGRLGGSDFDVPTIADISRFHTRGPSLKEDIGVDFGIPERSIEYCMIVRLNTAIGRPPAFPAVSQ